MGSALMAFGNRNPGSFVRLTQGKEAPNTVTWGRFNRHALIRLPIQAMTESGRLVTPPTIEFRLPDGSAHPHLLLAGVAQAMLLGRETEDLDGLLGKTATGGGDGRGDGAEPVPRSFAEVAQALEKHRTGLAAGGVFPDHFISAEIATLSEQSD